MPESCKAARVQRVSLGRERCWTVVITLTHANQHGEKGFDDRGIQGVNPA